MIAIKDKTQCCGCAACVQKCPKQCINFCMDEEGFFYPKVNRKLCVDCGLCEQVCPVLNQAVPKFPYQVMAVKNKCEDIRIKSSSGGIFTLIAERILKEHGVVFGARFDEKWNVVMDFTESADGLAAFRTSKYVQCFVGETYRQAERFLKQGRKVLYTGTPCMIYALRLFLRKEYDNLLTIDIVCHGVPSPGVWQNYLYVEEKRFLNQYPHRPILSGINFRDKTNGWSLFSFAFTLQETEGEKKTFVERTTFYHNPFMRAFWRDLILRPSCYQCPTRECKSGADITIGDFWSIPLVDKLFNDDKGVGVLLVNTDKGSSYLPSPKLMDSFTASFQLAKEWNGGFNLITSVHTNRKRFFIRYQKNPKDVVRILKRETDRTFCDKVRDKLLNIFK